MTRDFNNIRFDGGKVGKLLTKDGIQADLFLDFYDANVSRTEPISSVVIPMTHMEPFKPVHLDIQLPYEKQHLIDDLDVDGGLKLDPTMDVAMQQSLKL